MFSRSASRAAPEPFATSLPRPDPPSWWRYEMQWDAHEVTPGLFIGPWSVVAPQNPFLQSASITHVLMLRQPADRHPGPELAESLAARRCFSSLVEWDVGPQPSGTLPIPLLRDLCQSIHFILQNGGRVLVCCSNGSRVSGLLAVAYLLQTDPSLSVTNAAIRARARRFCLTFDSWDLRQLKELEHMVQTVAAIQAAAARRAASLSGLDTGLNPRKRRPTERLPPGTPPAHGAPLPSPKAPRLY
ncbi:hypothetical protein H696_01509 [Fonticula alba]|uniref:Tyrosine specific protein phosphatases domain-containing protein n=1 Tax=Fonticula alba TaxID=691883 RepID=A0A058ZDV3_FONAL|nr:hypothetical protein H696_01509 [Fonticula alba]KCV72103.1 hypothetical protein H696_01509 [Fonticula alba]|eukprot:XP_009493681.1 hypothetical protein H696_01509 [Fonticula alba]